MYYYLRDIHSEKPTAITMRYYLKNEKKYFKYPVGQSIHPDDWDKGSRMPKLYKGRKGFDTKHIAGILEQHTRLLHETIQTYEQQNKQLTPESLKKIFDSKFKQKEIVAVRSDTLVDAIDDFIEQKNKTKGQTKSWNSKYQNLKNKILIYEKHRKTTLKFDDINQNFYDDFAGFLRTINEPPFKPHNDNTLYRAFGFLGTFLRWAKGEYHDIPLKNLKVNAKMYQADDIFSTKEELNILENMTFKRKALERTRDLYLIGAYSGQRFSDYSIFEKSDIHNNIIIKKAQKTKEESYIPISSRLLRLLEKYNYQLPKLSQTKFNKYIKEVGKLAGFDETIKEVIIRGNQTITLYHKKYEMLGSHSARRTFITLSAENGMPDHIIMKITGIKDIKTLQKYKKTSQKSVIDAMNKVWE